MSLVQDGWKRELVYYWRHPDIPGWEAVVGFGPIRLFTPENEPVTDNEGNPWEFRTLDEVYEFVRKANDPDGA